MIGRQVCVVTLTVGLAINSSEQPVKSRPGPNCLWGRQREGRVAPISGIFNRGRFLERDLWKRPPERTDRRERFAPAHVRRLSRVLALRGPIVSVATRRYPAPLGRERLRGKHRVRA